MIRWQLPVHAVPWVRILEQMLFRVLAACRAWLSAETHATDLPRQKVRTLLGVALMSWLGATANLMPAT